jgi:hypothetical protein
VTKTKALIEPIGVSSKCDEYVQFKGPFFKNRVNERNTGSQ